MIYAGTQKISDIVIGAYAKTVKIFTNVQTMKEDTALTQGQQVRTLGFYSANDGGGAHYIVSAKPEGLTEDIGYRILLQNNLVADLLADIGEGINVLTFGIKNDKTPNPPKLMNNIHRYVYEVSPDVPAPRSASGSGLGIHQDTPSAISIVFPTGIYIMQSYVTDDYFPAETTEDAGILGKYFDGTDWNYMPALVYKGCRSVIASSIKVHSEIGVNKWEWEWESGEYTFYLGYGNSKITIQDFTFADVIDTTDPDVFYSNKNAIYYHTTMSPADLGSVDILDCWFYDNDTSIYIHKRSSMTRIDKCKFCNNKLAVDLAMSEMNTISNCWFTDVSRRTTKDDGYYRAQSPIVLSYKDDDYTGARCEYLIDSCLFVPGYVLKHDDYNLAFDVAWISTDTTTTVNNCRFGSEGASVLRELDADGVVDDYGIGNWFTTSTIASPQPSKGYSVILCRDDIKTSGTLSSSLYYKTIKLTNNYSVFCPSNSVIVLDNLPAYIIFENNAGLSTTSRLIKWSYYIEGQGTDVQDEIIADAAINYNAGAGGKLFAIKTDKNATLYDSGHAALPALFRANYIPENLKPYTNSSGPGGISIGYDNSDWVGYLRSGGVYSETLTTYHDSDYYDGTESTDTQKRYPLIDTGLSGATAARTLAGKLYLLMVQAVDSGSNNYISTTIGYISFTGYNIDATYPAGGKGLRVSFTPIFDKSSGGTYNNTDVSNDITVSFYEDYVYETADAPAKYIKYLKEANPVWLNLNRNITISSGSEYKQSVYDTTNEEFILGEYAILTDDSKSKNDGADTVKLKITFGGSLEDGNVFGYRPSIRVKEVSWDAEIKGLLNVNSSVEGNTYKYYKRAYPDITLS